MWAKVSLFVFVFRLLAKNSAANKSKLPARKGGHDHVQGNHFDAQFNRSCGRPNAADSLVTSVTFSAPISLLI
jgi:hypothetical protein